MIPNISVNPTRLYTAIIFDLGDVLFTWSPSTPASPLPANVFRNILQSSPWFEYEKGNLNEVEVYSLVSKKFSVDLGVVKDAFRAAQESLQCNKEMLGIIQELKEMGLSIYAMSNISAPSWEILKMKATPAEWALFDYTFTSASARQRKPNLAFFKHVIEKTGIDPLRTIFVDDKLENVFAARSLGMHGIVFDNQSKVIKDLKNLCYDPVSRGKKFLAFHQKELNSVTSNNIEIPENFTQLLILEATGDESLVDYVKHPGQFHFFKGRPIFTTELFPNDLDTTSLGLTISNHVATETKHRIMDEMLEYRDPDGIIQVYYDHSRPRTDAGTCVNVLDFFYRNGRGHELARTLDWIEQVLTNRAYTIGTYYYPSPDIFLFFLSRLIHDSAEVRKRLGSVFKERVLERFGVEGDSLSLAARIIAAAIVDLTDKRDFGTLLSMQCEDGSWGNGWFYRYGISRGILVKNDGLTTALAIRGIELVRSLLEKQSTTPAETFPTHL